MHCIDPWWGLSKGIHGILTNKMRTHRNKFFSRLFLRGESIAMYVENVRDAGFKLQTVFPPKKYQSKAFREQKSIFI